MTHMRTKVMQRLDRRYVENHLHQKCTTIEQAACGLSLLCIYPLFFWSHHLDLPLKITPSMPALGEAWLIHS